MGLGFISTSSVPAPAKPHVIPDEALLHDSSEFDNATLTTQRITIIMAKKAKSRTVAVRLMSMAMTGFYMTFKRARTHRPLSMLKYDPVVKKKVLFLEQKRGGSR